MTSENREQPTDNSFETFKNIIYDDETIQRMTAYFKQSSTEDLLKYIKQYGIHRHSDLLSASRKTEPEATRLDKDDNPGTI